MSRRSREAATADSLCSREMTQARELWLGRLCLALSRSDLEESIDAD